MTSAKKLDFLPPFLFLALLIAFLGGLFFFLNDLNKKRAQEILTAYTNETKKYIEENKFSEEKGGLVQMLEGFNMQLEMCLSQPVQLENCRSNVDFRGSIDYMVTHNLKDWSSTGFILKSNENSTFYLVGAGGDLRNMYLSPSNADQLLRLFSGELSQIPWADYTTEYLGKEVIVPVKDASGKIIAAIIRGVIEERVLP